MCIRLVWARSCRRSWRMKQSTTDRLVGMVVTLIAGIAIVFIQVSILAQCRMSDVGVRTGR